MIDHIKDKILSNRLGQIGGITFSTYTFLWAVIEPLNIQWISNHAGIWRTLLIVLSLLVTGILTIQLTNNTLETIDANGPGKTLQESYRSYGRPTLSPSVDGILGNVVSIKGDFTKDPVDWPLKSSAQKASKLEFIYNHTSPLHFYLRVMVISQNGDVTELKWIRFDHDIGVPDRYQGHEEMACPYNAVNVGSFLKVNIDIREAVKNTFGKGGWEYEKTMLFRIRGNGLVKSISFKK